MIQHTVAFRLKHPPGSAEETEFLQLANELRKVPCVINFQVFRQVGAKNNFTFGLSMHFTSAENYEKYNKHPDHVYFVDKVWLPEVEEFLEIDYQELNL